MVGKVKILTVCSNGLGSSLMLKNIMEEILTAAGIVHEVENCDYNLAKSKGADYIVTVKEFTKQMEGLPVITVRSFINRKKVEEDVAQMLAEIKGAEH